MSEGPKTLGYRQALAQAQRESRKTRKTFWVMEKDGAYAVIPFGKAGMAQAQGWKRVGPGVRSA